MKLATYNFSNVSALFTFILLTVSCDPIFKNDYKDNSPTSGKLRILYDEGLGRHIANQAYTFESQYPNVELELIESTENEAVQALYDDRCEAIVITRLLNEKEKKAFEAKLYFPHYTAVAKTGLAIISSTTTPLNQLTQDELRQLLDGKDVLDSTGKPLKLNLMVDRNNSAVVHYLTDSILKSASLSKNCSASRSTLHCIDYVSDHPNALGLIDFAWLSDRDDSLNKALEGKIKFIGVTVNGRVEYPNQSTFKTASYPFTRTVYVMRKTGDFTLAKGFESFVAGPKGQITFLKQGLLPTRQAERKFEIKTE